MGLNYTFIILFVASTLQKSREQSIRRQYSFRQSSRVEFITGRASRGMSMRFCRFSVIFQCTMHLWFSLMWNFRFSARTIRHFLFVRGRKCVRPRSTTTDHLSPTALVHTAPPRHSRPVTANRPPSPPPPSSPLPTTLCTEIKELWDDTRECMYASTYDHATYSLRYFCSLGVARHALRILVC